MKKYILLFMLFAFCAQSQEFEEEVQFAKDYGLAYCLDNFYQTPPSNDIGVARSIYFQLMVIGPGAYDEIYNYIKKYMSQHFIFDINPDNPKEKEPVYFIMCLEMYKSQEFHTEIEKIVKKVFDKWEKRK